MATRHAPSRQAAGLTSETAVRSVPGERLYQYVGLEVLPIAIFRESLYAEACFPATQA